MAEVGGPVQGGERAAAAPARRDVGGTPRAPSGVAGAVLAAQATAGNRAVAQRLAGKGGDAATATAAPRCGGATAVVLADTDDAAATPLSTGVPGAQTLTWDDFTTVDAPRNGLDANTSFGYSRTGGTYTASFNAAGSWATSAAKTSADSATLLRHEQGHLDLAVVLAGKATAQGTNSAAGLQQLLRASTRETNAYDTDTDHGTIAAQQTAWEAKIAGGTVTFP